MDHFLKFVDEAEYLDARGDAVLTCDLDVIGEIPDAVGFHVNARGELPEMLAAFEIDAPSTPYRVFAP